MVAGMPPPPFTPSSISGLKFWVQADNLSLSDGDPVATWTDLSGVGNTVTAASTARPTYKTNIQNSKPIVRFDGSANVMNKASFSGVDGLTGMTIFLVVKEAALTINKVYLTKWDYASQGSWAFQTGDGSSDQVTGYIADSITDTGTNHNQSNDANLTTAFYILAMVYDGSQSAANRLQFYKNGTLLTTTNVGTIPTSLTTCTADFRVGQFGGALTRNFNGDFGEIEIFNSALSSTNMTNMWTYLNARWAAY